MRFRLASAVAALALTTACSVDDRVNRPANPDLELHTGLAAVSLLQDDSRPIGAIVRDRNTGEREAGVQITYVSGDADVAYVSSDGVLLGLAGGTATITMTAYDSYQRRQLTAQLPVTVVPNPAVAVELTPSSVELFVGDTLTIMSAVLNADGLDLFRRPRHFWVAETDTAIATVTGGGMVTAKQAGTARIVVEAEGFRDTATVEVPGPAPVATITVTPKTVALAVGDTQALSVVLLSPRGRQLTDRTIAFESSDPSVATVDAEGVITAVGVGSATVTVTSEGKTASVTVTVEAAR